MACKQIVNTIVEPETRTGFDAEIRVGSLGHLNLVQFHNSPMQVAHTAAHVSHTRSDICSCAAEASGQVIIEQDAREVLLDVGLITLVDPLLPYKAKFLKGSTTLIIKVPRGELEARLAGHKN